MLVVLAIISIITAVALPSLAISQRWQLEQFATQLRSDIRLIQSMSMATGERYCIELTNDAGYTVKCSADGKVIKTVPLHHVKKITYNSSEKIEFTPKGTINNGRTLTVFSQDYTCKLVIRPVTGKVDKLEVTKINSD